MVKIAVRQAADLLGAVAVDLVVAGAAVHGIVALAADHVVAARAAVDVVVTGLAEQEVVVVAEHRIVVQLGRALRSEEHTSELQSLMRISYAVFCLKNKK